MLEKAYREIEENLHVYFDVNLFSEENATFLDKNENHEITQL